MNNITFVFVFSKFFADARLSHLQTVCGALETGVYRPVIEEWTEFTNILGTEMDNIIQGTKTMDEALAYAQEQLEQLMA